MEFLRDLFFCSDRNVSDDLLNNLLRYLHEILMEFVLYFNFLISEDFSYLWVFFFFFLNEFNSELLVADIFVSNISQTNS